MSEVAKCGETATILRARNHFYHCDCANALQHLTSLHLIPFQIW